MSTKKNWSELLNRHGSLTNDLKEAFGDVKLKGHHVRQLGDIIHEQDQAQLKTPVKCYQVYSPDGITIEHGSGYTSFDGAVKAFDLWMNRYADQGYYSFRGRRLSLITLDDNCLVKEFINGKWFNWGTVANVKKRFIK